MKKKKTYNKLSTILYLGAAAFYIVSIICFFGKDTRTLGIVFLCSGSSFLCLASALVGKAKKEEKEKSKEEEKE